MEQYFQDVEMQMASADEADKLIDKATANNGDYYAFSPSNVIEAVSEDALSKDKTEFNTFIKHLQAGHHEQVGRLFASMLEKYWNNCAHRELL